MTSAHRSIREIRLTNTMTGKKEVFAPQVPGKVTFYSCGPTVYGLIHIGNLRGGLVADLTYRYLKRAGYDVNYVRNYTDVDDKIITKGREEGISPEQVAKKYTQEAERDYAMAGMLEPTHKPCVTTHINEIIALIQRIIANGIAYVAPDGEVLFEINRFPGYGKLSHKQIDELVAGARVEVSDKKRNPLDFALWKPAKPGEPAWDSPWGKGRPGWHIECSAMSSKWLGDQIDLHHGGEDLIFPHHENEIAQSEAASGHAPFVKVWLHHAFLTLSKEKMSKSLGNVFSARDFLSTYGGEMARYLLLGVHYRSIIDFDEKLIENTLSSLTRIYEAKQKALELSSTKKAAADLRAEGAWGSFVAECEQVRREIDDQYANDLNTPGALAALFTLIRSFNRTLSEPLAQGTPSAVLGAQEFFKVLEDDIGSVIGVGRLSPEKALKDFDAIRLKLKGRETSGMPTAEEIQALIEKRLAARAAKNFAEADQIRKDLDARGVVLKDSPQGTTWSYKAD
jgi:cysteinyl-tRNA synthetase